MNRYSYQASNERYETLSGEIDASSVAEAVAGLDKLGLTVQSIQMIPAEKIEADAELAEFHDRIQQLLDRRSEWLPALEASAMELPIGPVRRNFQAILQRMKADYTPQQFLASRDAIQLLPILANGLDSETEFNRLDDWLAVVTHRLETRARLLSILLYPAILALLSLGIIAAYAIFLVPTFGKLFGEMEITIPKLTALMLWISHQLTHEALRTTISLFAISTVSSLVVVFWRRHALTNRLFRTFVAGSTSNLLAMSTLIGTLAELLALKAPLDLSISLAGRSCRHYFFEQATEKLSSDIRSRKIAVEQSVAGAILPPMLMYALHIGNGGRPSIPLLRALTRIYSERAQNRSGWLLEGVPIAMVVMLGFVVSLLVIALFLPMISMITTLSQ